MDKKRFSTEALPSWIERIAAAARAQETRGIAALVKPGALIAAAAGRMDLVERWLQLVPDDLIERDPQLLYWSGVTVLFRQPAEARPRLERAFEQFASRSKTTWMLLEFSRVIGSAHPTPRNNFTCVQNGPHYFIWRAPLSRNVTLFARRPQNDAYEYADGRIEPLSVQFQRQIELLAALIGKEGTLHGCIVPAVSLAAHALTDSMPG